MRDESQARTFESLLKEEALDAVVVKYRVWSRL